VAEEEPASEEGEGGEQSSAADAEADKSE
jgi:hypothetical protein